MTAKELNTAIKRLAANIKSGKVDPLSDQAHKEYNRLYDIDREMEWMNKNAIIIMVVLNRKFHYVQFHQFGPSDY